MFQNTHLIIIIEFIWNNVLSIIINKLAQLIVKYFKKLVNKYLSKNTHFIKSKLNLMAIFN